MKIRSANEIYRNPGIDPAVNHPNRRQIVMKNTGRQAFLIKPLPARMQKPPPKSPARTDAA